MGPEGRPPSDRIYRWLLLAYPAGFRHEYGPEMVRVFRDLLRGERGRPRPVRFWIRILADVAASAPGEHMETLFHERPQSGRRPASVWIGFVAAALALLAGAEALLRSLAVPVAHGPDLRPVPETFPLVVIGALAPVALGVLFAVSIALTAQKHRLRSGRKPSLRLSTPA